MHFDNPFVILAIFVAPIFWIAGLIQYLFPPKKINHLYGYRTKASMRNEQNWKIAQSYSAKIMIIEGFLYNCILLALATLPLGRSLSLLIGVTLMVLLILTLLFLVERKLKREGS